jgi:hypothetical protein
MALRARRLLLLCAAAVAACGGRDSNVEAASTAGGALGASPGGAAASGGKGEPPTGPPIPPGSDGGGIGPVDPSEILPTRELVITALDVVEDPVRTAPGGSWSFDRLIREMAGAHDPQAFVMRWLTSWRTEQLVNGYLVPARPPIDTEVIGPWRARSGCSPTDETCKLDLTRSPFRLSAIVYRPDLRSLPENKAGEGRFVFGVFDARGQAMPFTVIFEYLLPMPRGAVDVLDWADRFHRLGRRHPGQPFNGTLQRITDQFAGAGAAPDRPNGSALSQIRTNELALHPLDPVNPGATQKVWELREFVIGAGGWLQPSTVKQNPDLSFNGTRELADFLLQNQASIRAGIHQVPAAMLGGVAPVPNGVEWGAADAGIPEDVRHLFGLATCNGCHRWENQNPSGSTLTFFTHIAARDAGTPAGTSRFLRSELAGVRVNDFAGLLSLTPADLLAKEGNAPKKARVH